MVIILLTFYSVGTGQRSEHYPNYTIQDGLPSNRIYSILQDGEGYIYVGTDKGLCKFDGFSFDCMGFDEGLPHLEVLGMYQDRVGRIWISSFSEQPFFLWEDEIQFAKSIPKQNGAMIFNYGFINPDTLIVNTNKVAYYLNIHTLSVIKTIKLNKNAPGVKYTLHYFRYQNDKRISPRLDGRFFNYHGNNYFFSVNVDSFQRSIVLPELSPYIEKFGPFKSGNSVENDSLLFARSTKGLLTFTIADKKLSNIFLEHADIFSLQRDRRNRLWVGTKNNGLYIIDNKILLSKQNVYEYKIADVSIFKEDQYSESSLFFITIDNKFISLNLGVQKITTTSLNYSQHINDLTIRDSRPNLIIKNNEVFKYTHNGRTLKLVEQYGQIPPMKHIIELDSQNYCVFTDQITFYNSHNQIGTLNYYPSVRTTQVERLNDSLLIIGTIDGHHILHYNQVLGVRSIVHSKPNGSISDIERINDSMYCVASDANGIQLYNFKGDNHFELGSWTPPNDYIKQLQVDNESLLILSNKGLYRSSLPDFANLDFIETNGSRPANFICKKNNFLTVVGDNVVQVYADTIYSQKQMSELKIVHVTSNSESVDPINLNAYQNNLDIKLSVPYFSQKTPSIHYKLEGADEQELVSNDRMIRLRNLTSGHYTFIAQAYVGGKPISQKVYLPIEIRPVFWKTWWFICLVILFITSLIYYYFQQAKYKQQAKTALLQQRLNALHAQMNPHFLFNALQSLQYYISKNDTKRINTYLSTFATLVRKTLESSAQEYILLEDEVDYLTSYLEMEKEKLDGNLQYTFVCNDSLKKSTMIPTMIIQPFVENSIVHGFGSRPVSNLIQVSFEQTTSKEVRCEITDNGTFKPPRTSKSKHKSFSSKSVENRIKLLYQLHETSSSRNKTAIQILSNMDAGSVFEEGTTVRLTLPCIQAST